MANLSEEDYTSLGLAAIDKVWDILRDYKAMFDTTEAFLTFADRVCASCTLGARIRLEYPDAVINTKEEFDHYAKLLLDKSAPN